jgi:putative phosphoribosyl transferase
MTSPSRFQDRADAGRRLAGELGAYAGRDDVVVLGLPRGGVPVAAEVARAIGAPLDVFVVRKLGVPTAPEYAMGAIATGGVRVVNEDVVQELGITDDVLAATAAQEQLELERREQLYRAGRPDPDLRDRTVVVVDDGLATGATMRAAVQALRAHAPREIVVAVPVAAHETCDALRDVADTVVCPLTPAPFTSVGEWYVDFEQLEDEAVRALLNKSDE